MTQLIQIQLNKMETGKSGFPVDYNITVSKGERIVVLGKSGNGKSTLLDHICHVALQANHRIGYCFQNEANALFKNMNVIDNITCADEHDERQHEQTHIKAVQYLTALGMIDRLYSHPFSDDGKDRFSGGEMQRVGIARALSRTDGLLLCDEPISAVDGATKELVTQILGEQQDLGVVIVTHELNMLSIATRVLFIEDGSIIFDGSVSELHNCTIRSVKDYLSAPVDAKNASIDTTWKKKKKKNFFASLFDI